MDDTATMLRQAYESMAKRYGIRPEGPLFIELYATERDFAVRTSGLPRLGVQGVCFGNTLTALSPRAQPVESFIGPTGLQARMGALIDESARERLLNRCKLLRTWR